MRKFCSAQITDKRSETGDSVVLKLAVPEKYAEDFRYRPGQHIPVQANIDGTAVRRTYSICAPAGEQALRLGIRVQEGGIFSNYVADKLNVGDSIEIMPPTGRFNTELDPSNAKTYVAFVAGSGITPLLSIIATTLDVEQHSRFIVFYGNRMRATTMFIEDLWALKNRYMDRLSLHFIMSQEESEIELYSGRLTGDKVKSLHSAFLEGERPDDYFLCGPNPMIDELTEALVELGAEKSCIHSERFRPGLRGEATPKVQVAAAPKEGTSVGIVMDGRRQTFRMEPDDTTILDAAHANGLELPYSCKGGVCATCRALLTKGEVAMGTNYALEPWETERGYILTCQSSPKTAEIELDFDRS